MPSFWSFSVLLTPEMSPHNLAGHESTIDLQCNAGAGAGVPSQLIPITPCPGEPRARLPLQIATDFPAAVSPGVPALPLVSN